MKNCKEENTKISGKSVVARNYATTPTKAAKFPQLKACGDKRLPM
jgi:hypothetical protein